MRLINKDISARRTFRRLVLITLGAVLMAFNINTFVHAGGLIPGGFTGITLLIKEIFLRYLNITVPFSVILYVLNIVPAIFCYRFIGKRFTLYSVLMIFLSGLMTDFMPEMFIDLINLRDMLLYAVFGGILNAVAILLCLFADATSGGTDFIAIIVAEKQRKDAWSYIFAGNCFILVIAACFFTLEKALYSIIFQFATTMVINTMYNAYHQKTLLVITTRPAEAYSVIDEKTHHGATLFNGVGMYNMEERSLLYSVVYSNEIAPVMKAIQEVDPDAFINVIKTEQLNGRFFKRLKD